VPSPKPQPPVVVPSTPVSNTAGPTSSPEPTVVSPDRQAGSEAPACNTVEPTPSPEPTTIASSLPVSGLACEAGVEVDVLRDGIMSIDGRMPWSSNATFLVTLAFEGAEPVEEALAAGRAVKAIYKPHKGERPLWDFPSGLYQREVAMYELAAFFGVGSVQLFVDADFDQHYFTLMETIETRKTLLPSLRTLATLDLLANNADRKSGHVLVDGNNGIWGIDHGLCFHEEFKLRTVMWDFAGDRIPKVLSPAVERLADATPGSLGPLDELLDGEEIRVLIERARRLVRKPTFPAPHSDYAYPWPMV
jgi:uncharacterized repeat protein (TIGR03843 family)